MRRLGFFAFAFAFTFLFFIGDARPDDEQAGRRIYLEGLTPSGEPLTALVGFGRTPLSGAAVACGNCHGADGKGRAEGSVLPSEITWQELTKPYGHAHGTSRRHRPFDERSFARAVGEGLDPDGNALDWAMPRYALSRAEAEALLAYLKRLGGEREPGIGEATLRIGVVLPEERIAEAMREALGAYVESVNRAGGIHRRRLELVAAHGELEARRRFAAEPVFARLSLAEPAPFAVTVDPLAERDAAAYRIFPGLDGQAGVLVEFAVQQSGRMPLRGAVVAPGAAPFEAAAQAAALRCAARSCGDLSRLGWYAMRFDADAAVRSLKAQRREQLFFFGPDDEFEQLLQAAGAAADASWQPAVYAPGALTQAALAARDRFAGKLFLAFPSSRSERSPEAARRSSLAAAVVLTEGLRRAGRDLTRESLVRALESLNNFDPQGYAPPVSFGPARHVGALGGYVVALDPGRGVAQASGWIALE